MHLRPSVKCGVHQRRYSRLLQTLDVPSAISPVTDFTQTGQIMLKLGENSALKPRYKVDPSIASRVAQSV
jgi:hypothetical protein